MTLNNHVIPFQLSNNTIRGNIVRLQTVVSEIVKRHEYPANIESLFADTLSITACLGSRMKHEGVFTCLLYTSPSPRDYAASRMPSSA